jgi:hypothetical protein
MLVYGIRCDKNVLAQLPKDTVADYYTDYGMLVFPSYSKATVLDAQGHLSSAFWDTTRLILQNPSQVYAMDLEQPFVSDAESAAIKIIQSTQTAMPDWYHVPLVVTPDMGPKIVVA